MLRVGIAGIGFMGMMHYLGYQRVRGVKVAAICTRNEKRLAGDWRDIKGNFGPQGEMMNLASVARYKSLEEMLADKNVDLIDLCLPPDLHAAASAACSKTGKHVFCEKPMALTTAECDRMLTAAKIAKKTLHIGHVLPFFPEYAFAYDAIKKQKYGRLLGGNFKRLISDPLWVKDFFDAKKVGGPLIDLHIHDAHFIRVLFGMPTSVTSQGRMRGNVVEYCNTQFRFEDPSLVVSATSGVIKQQGRPFTHGFEIHLEKATLLYELAVIDGKAEVSMPLTVLLANGKVQRPQLGGGDDITAFAGEIKEMSTAAARNEQSPLLSGNLARDAVVLCHKQTESVAKGKPVKV